MFVALWTVLWATHGLPSRASVYRGCPWRDPPMCLDAKGGIKAKRQPFVVVGVWSCQCRVVVSPARRTALFCEHFVAPTASAGCRSWMFFTMECFVQQILINMLFISFEISSHFSCLLPAVPLSILFTPFVDLFHSQEIALHRMFSGTAAGWACGWNCWCRTCCA